MARFHAALFLVCAIVLYLAAPPAQAAVGDIVTIAGGTIRDGGPGTKANILYPPGVATDSAGNLYIADRGNNRIRKVSPAGMITTVAGSSMGGYSGDHGPATSASLRMPTGIAVDSLGNLYIADNGNNCIRMVSAAGVITTLAGTGPDSAGFSGDGGLATSAALNAPYGVAVDNAGKVYFSDQGNHRVRVVAAETGIITTVAGTGKAGSAGDNDLATKAALNSPAGVAVGDNGELYIADFRNNRIRVVFNPGPEGKIAAFAGNGVPGYAGDNGTATIASLSWPSGVAVRQGDVYITDLNNQVIRKVSGDIITTVAGSGPTNGGYYGDGGPATQAKLRHPAGIAVDADGNLYVSEQGNDTVRKVTAATGIITTVAGGSGYYTGDSIPATTASLWLPWSIALRGSDLFIADRSNNRIRKVSAAGEITTVAGTGMSGPYGDDGPAVLARLGNPQGVAVDPATGDIYLADTGNNRIRKISAANERITTVAGTGTEGASGDDGPATAVKLNAPSAVACDGAGNIYFAEELSHKVRKISGGRVTTVAGNGTAGTLGDGGSATAANLDRPTGVAVDSSGNLYIADMGNNRIRKVSSGVISTVAGTGYPAYSSDNVPAISAHLYYPGGVAVDAVGNIYIADQYNHRIRKVSGVSGVITTVAGNGMWNYAGDNGPATAASLAYPTGLTVDRSGDLYIADRRNQTVRKVSGIAVAVPSAPTVLSATAGDAQATVTFSRPESDGGSAITGYTVTSHPTGGTDSNAGSTQLSHVVTGLANGTSYTFTVNASNAVGTGAPSAPSNAVTPATVPGAPVISVVTAGNGDATVAFTAPASDGGSAITGYTVASDPAGGNDSHAGSTTLKHLVTGLSNGTPYTFTVTAANGVGSGAPSAPSASVIPATAPGAPAISGVTGGNSRATVTFAAPASSGGSPITGYEVTSSPAGGVDVNAGETGLAHVVTGLKNGTPYTFTVTASNAAGTSQPSAPSSSVVPATVPGVPVIGTATRGNSQATVAFLPPAFNGGSTITGYRVISSPAGGTDISAGTTALRHTVSGLKNGTAYTFRVTATNAVGTSPPSAPSNTVIPATVPGAPVMGAAKGGNAQATVTFSAPASTGGSPVTGYTVIPYPRGGVDTNAGKPVLSHVITGLVNGTAYTFWVKATNAVGTGPSSAPSNSVVPATVPGAPVIGSATGGNAQATVTFLAPAITGGSRITGYRVTSYPAGGIDSNGGSTSLSHRVTGLKNGTAYTFTVRATNAVGTGPMSAYSNKVIPATVPRAPVIGAAKAGNAQASVTFSPPLSTGGSPITGYKVISNPAGGIDSQAGKTVLSHAITGLKNGTAYTFTVTATNAAGTSPPSAPSNKIIPTATTAAVSGVATELPSSTMEGISVEDVTSTIEPAPEQPSDSVPVAN